MSKPRISLGDVLAFEGITVNDWVETDIDGEEAEEIEAKIYKQ